MKKSMLLAMFVMISATVFGQVNHVNSVPQVWNNTPGYNTGGYKPLVLNSKTNRMELSPFTFLQADVIADTEQVAKRNYNSRGKFLNVMTVSDASDTVNLVNTAYMPNQLVNFISEDATTTHTVVIIPSSGNINGAAFYPFTGTAYKSLSTYFDGTNWWILNKQ